MRNIGLVIRHEIKTTLSRRSFWLLTVLFPAMVIVATAIPQWLAGDALDEANVLQAAQQSLAHIGYVDEAGIVKALPPGIPPDTVVAYPDEASAQAALEAGELDQYFVIVPDFLESGRVVAVSEQFNVFSGLNGAELVKYLVSYNLVDRPEVVGLLLDPTPNETRVALAPRPPRDEDNPFTFFVPFAAMFVLFFVISMTAGYMLRSVTQEKENRTVEVLLLSLSPRQLMVGKVLGLGVVALVQMAVWMGGGLLAMDRARLVTQIPEHIQLTPGFVILTLVYFVLGYLLYASALGALGALAPNVREGTQFTFIIILPLLLPFWLNTAFVSNPDGGVALVLSLIPLTAPTSMVARLAATQVPTWQVAVSLGGLLITTYGFVVMAARFFRPDTLLTSTSLSLRRILREARG